MTQRTFDTERFQTAKAAFELCQPGVEMSYDRGFWFKSGKAWHRRKWLPQRGSHFPKGRWYPWGGTTCAFVDQLIRWVRHQPTVPLSTIEYWFGPKVLLGDKKALDTLRTAGWPTSVDCVMCGIPLTGRWDWYDWHGIGVDCSGPGCVRPNGCCGQAPENPAKTRGAS